MADVHPVAAELLALVVDRYELSVDRGAADVQVLEAAGRRPGVSAGTVESAAALLERFREYQRTGDRRIRNALVEEHLHVADHYAKRYRNRGVPVEDLRRRRCSP